MRRIRQVAEIERPLQQKEIAFIIGNGINRYPNNPRSRSWEDLLYSLLKALTDIDLKRRPSGISSTELYDVIDLQCKENSGKSTVKKEFIRKLDKWKYAKHHETIVKTILKFSAPVLTTNFDDLLAMAVGAKKYFTIDSRDKGFTDYYPWECYYAQTEVDDYLNSFAVWHVNGTKDYRRSIRLGLSDYMGMVQRARSYTRKGPKRLWQDPTGMDWKGKNTWLNIVFNKSLFIFGLELAEQEVFLWNGDAGKKVSYPVM
ncbi:MAG: hypothetical protein J7M30_10425 [Deltaproteobacteria bacterium]|nr:hypothetical protein [Deltaproteobacteria bacterium]